MNKLIVLRALIILEWFMLVPYFGLWFMMDALLPEQLQYWLIYEAEKNLIFSKYSYFC